MSKKYLWLAVTADEYELPLCVRDTCKELAAVYNVPTYVIYEAINKNYSGIIRGIKFVKVPLDEDEETENEYTTD